MWDACFLPCLCRPFPSDVCVWNASHKFAVGVACFGTIVTCKHPRITFPFNTLIFFKTLGFSKLWGLAKLMKSR